MTCPDVIVYIPGVIVYVLSFCYDAVKLCRKTTTSCGDTSLGLIYPQLKNLVNATLSIMDRNGLNTSDVQEILKCTSTQRALVLVFVFDVTTEYEIHLHVQIIQKQNVVSFKK